MSLTDEDFECPDCGGWAVMSERGVILSRDCDEDCGLTNAELSEDFLNDQQYRAEKAFEDSLSGDTGPLTLMQEVEQAWLEKRARNRA